MEIDNALIGTRPWWEVTGELESSDDYLRISSLTHSTIELTTDLNLQAEGRLGTPGCPQAPQATSAADTSSGTFNTSVGPPQQSQNSPGMFSGGTRGQYSSPRTPTSRSSKGKRVFRNRVEVVIYTRPRAQKQQGKGNGSQSNERAEMKHTVLGMSLTVL